MENQIQIQSDDNQERPVPTEWRGLIGRIVEHIRSGRYKDGVSVPGVNVIPKRIADLIDANIKSYGDGMPSLPDEAWSTSICMWMDGYWDVLVDLFTESGRSDLCLFLRVTKVDGVYRFDVDSVHVP